MRMPDAERLGRVRTAMSKDRLDVLVCRLPDNVVMLSGHWPLVGWTFYVFPLDGVPLCVCPRCDEGEAQDELWQCGCVSYPFGVLAAGDPFEHVAAALMDAARGRNWKRVGIEGFGESAAQPYASPEPPVPGELTRAMLERTFGLSALVDASELLARQKVNKTPAEAAKLRVASEVAAIGLEAFQASVAQGLTGLDLACRVEQRIVAGGTGHQGAQKVRAFAQVSTGPDETAKGFRPVVVTGARRLRAGEIALLELGVVVDGFWSDRTRVCSAGPAGDRLCEIFDVVRDAQAASVAAVRPGEPAGRVDEAARSIIHAHGYGEAFCHVTGHGLGFRYHEPLPLIAPGVEAVLEEGMVHSVEPGVYVEGLGGIRIEDDVLVAATGHEVLGPLAPILEGGHARV